MRNDDDFSHHALFAGTLRDSGDHVICRCASNVGCGHCDRAARGMSWSDVRVAALGTSLLGLFPAVIAFAAATLLSAFVQWGLRRRTSIQMAPYLVGATAVASLTFGG